MMNKLLSVLLISMGLSISASAQTKTIKGRVTDDEGKPAIGVTVTAKQEKGAITKTDESGNFVLNLKESQGTTLTFTSTEFNAKTLTVTGNYVDVKLIHAVSSGDEVIVVGYKSVKRKDLKAAVATMGASQIKDIPVSSAAEALTGKLAGVQVTTSEGSPDAEINLRVRGGTSLTQSNSPIYLVDGVQTEDALKSIAPQDIESIDVIKDPSILSIYGARGANGVIVITTKTPKTPKKNEKKFTITYNGSIGFRELPSELDVLDPTEFVEYQYERALMNSDTASFFNSYSPNDRTYTALKSFKDSNFVDWQKEVFGRKAFNQTHNVSVTGGTKSTQVTFGFTHNEEDAIMINSSFKRSLLNFKVNHKFSKSLKAGINARYTDQLVSGAGVSNKEGQGQNKLRNTIKYRPYLPSGINIDDFDQDLFDETSGNGLNLFNPVVSSLGEYRHNFTKIYNISGNIDIAITKYLSFKTTAGYNRTNGELREYYNEFTSEVRSDPASETKPITAFTTTEKTSINNSNVLTFNVSKLVKGKFKKHHDLTFLAGQETYSILQKVRGQKYGKVTNSFSPLFNVLSVKYGTPLGQSFLNYPTYSEKEERLASFFGKADYTLNKKYSASFSLRSDGASVLAPGRRWNTFSAGSLTWQVSDENFFRKLFTASTVNDLKFRFAYGGSGNAKIEPFLYLPVFSATGISNPTSLTGGTYTPSYSGGINGGVNYNGYASPYLANGLLKWETTTTKNLGLDLAMFNNRLQLSVDAYQNTTKDLLLRQTIPATSGYTSQIQNAGQTTNKGIDIQLSATVVNKKNFTWNTNFNIAFNKNVIDKVGYFDSLQFSAWSVNKESLLDYNARVGLPVGEMFGYVTDGFYTTADFDYNPTAASGSRYTLKKSTTAPTQTSLAFGKIEPGMIKLKDLDGDSVITLKDRTIIGHAQPKFTGGMNNQFTFLKNWDMSIFVNWVVGNDIYNANKIEFTSGYTKGSNMIADVNGRWKVVDESGNSLRDTLPAVYEAYNKDATMWIPPTSASSFFLHSWAIEDGSFLRINNVTLGYSFPKRVLSRMHLAKFRIYATVNNLAVLTKYSGYDPEANTRTSNPLTPGIDYSAYPRSRSYVAGVNVTF